MKGIRIVSAALDGKKSINSIVRTICGEMIGSGLYRDVYVLKQNPKYVVKVERDMRKGIFANASEWNNYINNREWKFLSSWLAPVELINETSQLMIQARVEHRPKKEYPKEIPVLFTDTKYKNFGWIDDRFVCCDYSFFPIYFIKVGGKKMKRAKWWGDSI